MLAHVMPNRHIVPNRRFAKISRGGGGFALNIPRDLVAALGWHYGTAVELSTDRGRLVIGEPGAVVGGPVDPPAGLAPAPEGGA